MLDCGLISGNCRISKNDGNAIIEKIISCLSGKNLTLSVSKCLLEEAAKELENRATF